MPMPGQLRQQGSGHALDVEGHRSVLQHALVPLSENVGQIALVGRSLRVRTTPGLVAQASGNLGQFVRLVDPGADRVRLVRGLVSQCAVIQEGRCDRNYLQLVLLWNKGRGDPKAAPPALSS